MSYLIQRLDSKEFETNADYSLESNNWSSNPNDAYIWHYKELAEMQCSYYGELGLITTVVVK